MIYMTKEIAEDLGILDSNHPITANVVILSDEDYQKHMRDLIS